MPQLPQWLADLLKTVSPSLVTAIATLMATAVTASATIVGTFLVVFIPWMRERGEANRRSHVIKEAIDQATFWKQWYEAQLLACPAAGAGELQNRVKSEVDLVAKELRWGIARPAQPRSFIRRALLLHWPLNVLVWIPRAYFYYLVVKWFLLAKSVASPSFWSSMGDLAEHLFKQPPVPAPDPITFSFILSRIDPEGVAVAVFTLLYLFYFVLLRLAGVLIVRAIAVDLDRDPDLGAQYQSKILSLGKRWIVPRLKRSTT
ncbi:MAG TPA: hypothetical protein VE377_19900 [Candidatus Dormibacteraeota bacterium]|nr:hypothetical protein [Candidatus Dormibacteraeota bacterium]